MKALFAWVTLALLLSRPAVALSQDANTSQSPPEALNIYSDAANFQNKGEFALAAEDWETFLKRFPNDPLAKKARHYAGVCYLQLKAYDKAAGCFETVLKEDPKFELAEDALLNLGWSRYSLANRDQPQSFAKSAEAFASLVKQFPKGKYADQGLFYLGESLYVMGNKPQATAAYRKLVDEHVRSALRGDGLYALGVTYEEVQQFAEAGKAYDLFLKEYSDHPLQAEVRMRKAETILQAGDLAAAERMFAEAAASKEFASADHALLRQAFCAAQQGKFSEAGKLYAKLAADFPQSSHVPEAILSAGRSFYRANELTDAVTWFQKAIDADQPGAPEAAHWICRVHLKNGTPAKALALAGKLLAKGGESTFVVHLLMDQADALYESRDTQAEALTKYLEIAQQHPTHELAPQALYNAAFAALQLQQYEGGLKHCASFLDQYPEDRLSPDVQYVAADCRLKLNQFAEAETAYRKLLQAHGGHDELSTWQVRLGLVLYLQKKYPEAIAALKEIASGLPQPDQVAEAQFLIGASQFQLGQFDAAVQALTAALAADAQWRQADETLLYLSRAQRGLNQLDAAKTTLARLIREFPESSLLDQAHYRLGEFAYAASDFPGAIAAYEAVTSKWPNSAFAPYAYYGKGWAHLKAKQFPPGVESFTALISKHAGHALVPEAYFARGMCRRQAGDFANAITDVDAYLKTDPPDPQKSDALYERGLAEVANGNLEQATKSFEALLASNKEYANAASVLYELAWTYTNRKQADQATAAFAKLATDHPQSPLAAEASLHVAEDRYDKQQLDDAAKFYAAAKQAAQRGEIGERATHKLAWTYFRQNKFGEALSEFGEQLQAYPEGELAADGLFMKAETLFKLERYADAVAAFDAARQKPSSDLQKQVLALLHAGQSAAQTKKWQDSLQLLDQIPTKFAESPYLAEAFYERGWARQNLNQLDDAAQDYAAAAERSRGLVGARAQFMLGEVYFQQKKFDEAIGKFKRVMYGYGGDSAAEEIKPWQALSAYEAGRCAEVQIQGEADAARKEQLIADAKASFAYVVERHPQHEKAALARDRLAALANL